MQLPSAARTSTPGVGADPLPPSADPRSASTLHDPSLVEQRRPSCNVVTERLVADPEARSAGDGRFEAFDGDADLVRTGSDHPGPPSSIRSVDRPILCQS